MPLPDIDDFLIDKVAQPVGEFVHSRTGVGIYGQARRALWLSYVLSAIDTLMEGVTISDPANPWTFVAVLCSGSIWVWLWRLEYRDFVRDERSEINSAPWTPVMRPYRLFSRINRGITFAILVGTAATYILSPTRIYNLVVMVLWTTRLAAHYLRACTPKPPRRRAERAPKATPSALQWGHAPQKT